MQHDPPALPPGDLPRSTCVSNPLGEPSVVSRTSSAGPRTSKGILRDTSSLTGASRKVSVRFNETRPQIETIQESPISRGHSAAQDLELGKDADKFHLASLSDLPVGESSSSSDDAEERMVQESDPNHKARRTARRCCSRFCCLTMKPKKKKDNKPSAKRKKALDRKGDYIYKTILVCDSRWRQFANDIRNLNKHRTRAATLKDVLVCKNLASPQEMKVIEAQTGQTWEDLPRIKNMLVWRRSALRAATIAMFGFVCVFTTRSMWNMEIAWVKITQDPMVLGYDNWVASELQKAGLSPGEQTTTAPPEGGASVVADVVQEQPAGGASADSQPEGPDISFTRYFLEAIQESHRVMTAYAKFIEACAGLIFSCGMICALYTIQRAMMSWTHSDSRKWVVASWLIWTGSPWIAALLPPRLFMTDSAAAMDEVFAHLRVDVNAQLTYLNSFKQAQDACYDADLRFVNTAQGMQTTAENVCKVTDKYLPPTIWVPGTTYYNLFTWRKVETQGVHTTCANAKSLAESGQVEEARAAIEEVCAEIRTKREFLVEVAEDGFTDFLLSRIKAVIQVAVTINLAIRDFCKQLPAALSIAPGFMQGALLMKMMVPQSGTPGLFIFLLPWMFAPLMWALYSLALQVIGDQFLFVGLSCGVLGPFAYVIIGGIYRLDIPMRDHMVERCVDDVQKVHSKLGLVGRVCLLIAVVRLLISIHYHTELPWLKWASFLPTNVQHSYWTEQEREIVGSLWTWEGFFTSRQVWSILGCVFTMIAARYYLSILASFDMMCNNLVEQHLQEQALRTMIEKEAKLKGKRRSIRPPQDPEKLAKELFERVEALCKLPTTIRASSKSTTEWVKAKVRGMTSNFRLQKEPKNGSRDDVQREMQREISTATAASMHLR